MKQGAATARVTRRRVTALLLLVVSLLLPLTPLLAATGSNTESSHACCRRRGANCCPKSSGASSGRFWNAAPDCGTRCTQPVGEAASILVSVAPSKTAAPRPAPAESIAALYSAEAVSACPAWLYQRPPPRV